MTGIAPRLSALLLVACSSSWAQSSAQAVNVSFSMEPTAITMHEPVVVRFEVVNESPLPRREGTARIG